MRRLLCLRTIIVAICGAPLLLANASQALITEYLPERLLNPA